MAYSRAALYAAAQQRAANIVSAMGWTTPGPSVLVFGCGFGWLAEAFEDLGFDRVVGTDTSAWIQSSKDATEEADIDAAIAAAGLDPSNGHGAEAKAIVSAKGKGLGPRCRASRGLLDEDGSTNQSRGRIRQALDIHGNDLVDWALTDDLARTMSDAEVLESAARLDLIATNSVHLTQTLLGSNRDVSLNWHTLEEWKALVPAHTWIEAGTYRTL